MNKLFAKALLHGCAGIALMSGSTSALAGPEEDKALNSAVIKEARQNIADIMRDRAASDDSRKLARLQEEFNARLKLQKNPFHSRMVYANAEGYGNVRALGMPPEEALHALLKAQGITTSSKSFSRLVEGLDSSSISEAWTAFSSTKPMAVSAGADGSACVVVPPTSYAGEFQGNVIDIDTFLEFINRHEGWHCLDSDGWRRVAKFPAGFTDQIEKMKPRQIVSSQQALDYIQAGTRIEAFADLGALGDMVVAGRDMGLFDMIIRNRAHMNQVDLLHTSTPVILGLKREIEGMGLNAFRAMTDESRMALYYKVLDAETLTGRQIGILIRYQDGGRAEKEAIEAKEDKDPDTARAMRYMRAFFFTMGESPQLRPPLTDVQRHKLREEVEAYDAGAALLDTAFKISGVVTPRSLLAAHEALQGDMKRQTKQNPANPLYPALAARLKKVIGDELETLDFAAVNRGYGVTPENSAELARYLNPVHKNFSRPQP